MVTGDHGEAFGDHSLFPNTPIVGHSGIPYEERVHVPLIVKFPGGKFAGETVDRLVSLIDIAPTVADVAGIQMETQGQSLRPVADVEQDRAVLIESRKDPNRPKYSAIRKDDHKLISVDRVLGDSLRTVLGNLLNWIRIGDELYYDLSADPEELKDRSNSHPGRTDRLRQDLIEIIESCDKAREAIEGSGTRGVNDEVKSQLQRLGYFEE
jgi:arylsulfatase A-like enzyme